VSPALVPVEQIPAQADAAAWADRVAANLPMLTADDAAVVGALAAVLDARKAAP
jgi:hypothetical protein